jgi:hypothetical protein
MKEISTPKIKIPKLPQLLDIGLWRNLKQKMDERAITGEKIWDMRNRSTDDLGVLK